MAFKYKSTTRWFRKQMNKKLAENQHKRHWGNDSIHDLFKRIKDEVSELEEQLNKPNLHPTKIIKECADIGNFSMMVADNARKLELPETGQI